MAKTQIVEYLLTGVVALVMIGGGIGHFAAPENFVKLVPPQLPAMAVIYASGVWELAIGLAVLVPRWRAVAGLVFAALCLAYMPLHIWDMFRDVPAIGPHPAPILRLILQGLFIWAGVALWRRAGRAS